MKMKQIKKLLSLVLCIVLIVVMALFTTGCNDNENKEPNTTTEVTTAESSKVLGEGNTQFMFAVVDGEGNETEFEIHTDKTTVGEALLELGLIAGEEGEFGLYVKEVNGITADYDKDGTYWAFYVNDEYATTGVDATEITAGDSYAFKVEK